MRLKTVIFLTACLMAASVSARTLSARGVLAADDPNDVALITFQTLNTASLDVQTWSFGGGTNAAGAAIAAGGFDPYVSLFAGWGNSATFLASNDDGLCPPGHGTPACADSTLRIDALPAGRYTVAVSLPANFSFAENTGTGTLGDGFIGLAASWSAGACAAKCSSAYAVDVTSAALVPEPPPALLLALGLSTAAVLKRRRQIFPNR